MMRTWGGGRDGAPSSAVGYLAWGTKPETKSPKRNEALGETGGELQPKKDILKSLVHDMTGRFGGGQSKRKRFR